MKKIITVFFILILITGCAANKEEEPLIEEPATLTLPEKTVPGNRMSDSPITPANLDDYMFRDDSVYIDTRSVMQFHEEGSIEGFECVPFYDVICDFKEGGDALFYFKKVSKDVLLGDPGSFFPNFEESEEILRSLFSKDKNLLVISTAGVESCYLLNLLEQFGYDHAKLYNVGSFTTGMGKDIAYSSYEFAKYLVEPDYPDSYESGYDFSGLTRIDHQ